MLKNIIHQKNANQNHSAMPLHTHYRMATIKKTDDDRYGKNVEKHQNPQVPLGKE